MMQQLVKALEDDYTKLKSSQNLLKHQTPMRGSWEGEACNPASYQPWSPPHQPGVKGDKSHWKASLSTRKNALIVSPTALPPTWPSMGNNCSWLSKPWTSPTRCMKRLRWMAIQRLNSLCRLKTDALNDWGAGDGLLSCGPFQKELA